MRSLLAALVALFIAVSPAAAWEKPAQKEEPKIDKTVREVLWQDATDLDMLKQVRSDIEYARNDKDVKTLRATLLSPGGPVITALEIARLVRKASDSGLAVEIHAVGLCASGCTFVLAAGTPGKRFVDSGAVIVVHGPRDGSGCVRYTHDAKTEEDKIRNTVLEALRNAYAKYTGKPREVTEKWVTCDNEQTGFGELAVGLGLADKVEG